MIALVSEGQYVLFACLLAALIASLTFHEFGHAWVAKAFGDDTAERAGRLSLNPLVHLDFMGLAMVIFVGIGYAKPVPTNPRNFSRPSADLWISAAGPFMNLILAFVTRNVFLTLENAGVGFVQTEAVRMFVDLLVWVNLLLMAFNLVPIAPLDGHYILPYLLPPSIRARVRYLNQRFGPLLLLSLIVLSFLGFPILDGLLLFAALMDPWITLGG
ncbi:MAG TPA: site-2 protease family protein [Pseudomonadales bacterium]|jgi:Zn-dependent protease|nr:site-2 protease family protein [Pseudomonadales bacterium]|tara:strand:+ start:34063 stop:34707 length:645 start_codon:yes stop_codon:yes gene_type:complete